QCTFVTLAIGLFYDNSMGSSIPQWLHAPHVPQVIGSGDWLLSSPNFSAWVLANGDLMFCAEEDQSGMKELNKVYISVEGNDQVL
ncbi:unnamed protein product, partial [Ilex paraguariensis]